MKLVDVDEIRALLHSEEVVNTVNIMGRKLLLDKLENYAISAFDKVYVVEAFTQTNEHITKLYLSPTKASEGEQNLKFRDDVVATHTRMIPLAED